ncbi:MAG: aminotransferase class I/II-fold pyridoxal phosphate-dependent enzyme [Candidatus Saccharimonadales bacterium]
MKKDAFGLKSPIDDGNLDLRVGNTQYLEKYWVLLDQFYNGSVGKTHIKPQWFMNYDTTHGKTYLKQEILALHAKVGNAETKDYEVVIGNGASQILSAAVFALARRGVELVLAKPPYWPRFNALSLIGGLEHVGQDNIRSFRGFVGTEFPPSKSFAEIITNPNNPDNKVRTEKSEHGYSIYDLCYNWPQYTNIVRYAEDIMVFSLGKATGHAGTRIGWALVKDHAIAEDMKFFIELSTSGVSEDAQFRATNILKTQTSLKDWTSCFVVGKQELDQRWLAFTKATKTFKKEFEPVNDTGMFAWCKAVSPADDGSEMLKTIAKVLSVNGELFGCTKDYFRINLGSHADDFQEFIKRLAK